MQRFAYPKTRRDLLSETLHGVKICDPYRWLENPDSEEVKSFVSQQNKLVRSFLSQSPIRDKFEKKMTQLMDYEKYGCPMKRGSDYYYFHNSGLQAQSVLYKQSSLDAKGEIFLDPNSLSDDGTISIKTYSFSESGKYFAYGFFAL